MCALGGPSLPLPWSGLSSGNSFVFITKPNFGLILRFFYGAALLPKCVADPDNSGQSGSPVQQSESSTNYRRRAFFSSLVME